MRHPPETRASICLVGLQAHLVFVHATPRAPPSSYHAFSGTGAPDTVRLAGGDTTTSGNIFRDERLQSRG